MKAVYLTVVTAAALVAGVPVAAQVPGGAGVPVQANGPDTASQDKVICRTAQVIGSRLKPAKICKTARQWEADQMEQRRAVEKGQNERMTAGAG
jgi:hypothetical protein